MKTILILTTAIILAMPSYGAAFVPSGGGGSGPPVTQKQLNQTERFRFCLQQRGRFGENGAFRVDCIPLHPYGAKTRIISESPNCTLAGCHQNPKAFEEEQEQTKMEKEIMKNKIKNDII